MNIVTALNEWQMIRRKLMGKTIGFAPTMGNLHAGHLSLYERSQCDNDITVASIFINPTQFNRPDDFAHYPRTLEQDLALLEKQGVDYVLCPTADALYHDHYTIQIHDTALSHELEGAHRPGHFTGMLTIVLKLLNLVQATHAYFGEKDYQQLLLVKHMVAALFVPTQIIGCETVRAHDQLALSSRNTRLSPLQRQTAAHFPRLLMSDIAIEYMTEQLVALGFRIDYIAEKWQRRLGAVWLDDIRLIDNIALK